MQLERRELDDVKGVVHLHRLRISFIVVGHCALLCGYTHKAPNVQDSVSALP
jgi:hypothetical protein